MTSQRASAREAIATIGHALNGQSQLVMFVGGTVPALYPLEGGMALRPTLDVDCVVDLATTAEYYAFVERLRALGFRECTDENAPLCRLVYADIRVDIVATSATGIGPTNRWYRDAFAEAAVHSLDRDIDVRAITPLYFVATKLEAFRGRGAGDYQASHDLEDILTVLSGLPRLREQIAAQGTTVATFVRTELLGLAAKEAFIDAVPAHFEGDLIGQARADLVLAWLSALRGE